MNWNEGLYLAIRISNKEFMIDLIIEHCRYPMNSRKLSSVLIFLSILKDLLIFIIITFIIIFFYFFRILQLNVNLMIKDVCLMIVIIIKIIINFLSLWCQLFFLLQIIFQKICIFKTVIYLIIFRAVYFNSCNDFFSRNINYIYKSIRWK